MGRHEVGNFQNLKKDKVNKDLGCRMQASFKINKVPGNFHVSTHARADKGGKNPNFKHKIHRLVFGEPILSNVTYTTFYVPMSSQE